MSVSLIFFFFNLFYLFIFNETDFFFNLVEFFVLKYFLVLKEFPVDDAVY